MSRSLPGRIKAANADFKVWEIPGIVPEGTGDHLYVWLRKDGLSTPHVLSELARRCDLRARDLGCAGRKDKEAITEQWVSLPATVGGRLDALPADGVPQVLAEGCWSIERRVLHPRRLRTAQLRGNRFALRVTGLNQGDRRELIERSQGLATTGRLLNLFGEQRFVDQEALAKARVLLGERKLRGRQSRFVVSVAQAAIFNDYLQRRGDFNQAITGEWYGTDRGGRFDGEREPAESLQARLATGEICPLGPLPGRDVRPLGRCGELLAESLEACGLETIDWHRFGKSLRGAWRPLWVPISELRALEDADAVVLEFTLPPGSYATVLVQRLLEDAWIFPRSH